MHKISHRKHGFITFFRYNTVQGIDSTVHRWSTPWIRISNSCSIRIPRPKSGIAHIRESSARDITGWKPQPLTAKRSICLIGKKLDENPVGLIKESRFTDIPPHINRDMELNYVYDGVCTFIVNERRLLLKRATCSFATPA